MRVAIIGTAPTSRDLAPFDDPTWDIWACSPGNRGVLPRVNIWYEIHALAEMDAPENRAMARPYFAWLAEQTDLGKFQVVMQEFNAFVPKAIPFPRDEMIEKFGRNWFTSSIAWMMALAIARMSPGDEIALFGVDMAADQEHYTAQKAGCLRFIEIAQAAGIKVLIPKESSLGVSTPLYGYSEGTPFGRRINAVKYIANAQRQNMAAQIENMRLQQAFFDGSLEQLRYMERTWTDGAELELNLGALAAVVAERAATGKTGGDGVGVEQAPTLVPTSAAAETAKQPWTGSGLLLSSGATQTKFDPISLAPVGVAASFDAASDFTWEGAANRSKANGAAQPGA